MTLQLGSYFGAVLGVLPVSGNRQAGVNPVLLVGAPHFHGPGVGGEVRLCALDSGVRPPVRVVGGGGEVFTGNEYVKL